MIGVGGVVLAWDTQEESEADEFFDCFGAGAWGARGKIGELVDGDLAHAKFLDTLVTEEEDEVDFGGGGGELAEDVVGEHGWSFRGSWAVVRGSWFVVRGQSLVLSPLVGAVRLL